MVYVNPARSSALLLLLLLLFDVDVDARASDSSSVLDFVSLDVFEIC